jgi:hypothetical protein
MENVEEKKAVPPVRIVDVPITDENSAFNLLINFVHLAQKRGAYSMEESAKIWDCIKLFNKP